MLSRLPASLPVWLAAYEHAEIAVLPGTASAIQLLAQIEEAKANMDAHTIAEAVDGDPLMTLRVMAHVSRHCVRPDASAPETLIGAILMMGIGPFFREFGQLRTTEEVLVDNALAKAGLMQVIERSRRAARFAMGFALKRQDQDAEIERHAAMLHDFAEMLLWLHAPNLALEMAHRLRSDHTLRSVEVQRELMGIELNELALTLMRRWRLPPLLVRCTNDRERIDPQVRSVSLAVRIARHTQHGLHDPHATAALPDDAIDVGDLLTISPQAAMRLLEDLHT